MAAATMIMPTLIPTATPIVAFFERPLRRFGGAGADEEAAAAAAAVCVVVDGSSDAEVEDVSADDADGVDAVVVLVSFLQ